MNKTRLDSLRVGERFKVVEDGAVYLNLGVYDQDASQNLYAGASKRDTFALATIAGALFVIPLDPPPAVPS